ncbi:unnamed protein product, partial [Ceratitis capitata]
MAKSGLITGLLEFKCAFKDKCFSNNPQLVQALERDINVAFLTIDRQNKDYK